MFELLAMKAPSVRRPGDAMITRPVFVADADSKPRSRPMDAEIRQIKTGGSASGYALQGRL
jgi:hypothetical protein